MFHILTPELEAETKEVVENLKKPVAELNNKLQEFSHLVDIGFVRFANRELESMSSEYNKDLDEWLKNGAIADFITKMSGTYKHFDIDSYESKGGNPNDYVSIKKRRVILGSLGSIWIDIPMTGIVNQSSITKWTRAAFVYSGHWVVLFDPTADGCSFRQVEESGKYVKRMQCCGVEVDI